MRMLITGSGGLVGSESVKYFSEKGWEIIGIDNNSRNRFFGQGASISETLLELKKYPNFTNIYCNIISYEDLEKIFQENYFDVIIHTAAQPSHDLACNIPLLDFQVNAQGTLNLLELTRKYCPDAPFILTSTNKVYGDQPNFLNYQELETRFHPHEGTSHEFGFNENLNIDQCTHSLFGCSKLTADLYCQEYGKYFGLKTCIFRLGCITGSNHKGAKLHGFLNYLIRCVLNDEEYEIIGYKGKQVRDQIHAKDLVSAFEKVIERPVIGEIFNMGGGSTANCSVLEAIEIIEKISGKKLKTKYNPTPRIGDHKWYISDINKFVKYYQWKLTYNIEMIIQEIIENVK